MPERVCVAEPETICAARHTTNQVTAKSKANEQIRILKELTQSEKYIHIPEEAILRIAMAENSTALKDPFHNDWPFW